MGVQVVPLGDALVAFPVRRLRAPAMKVTSWEIRELGKRKFTWRAQRHDRVAEGEASSEGVAYMAVESCMDEFIDAERKENGR